MNPSDTMEKVDTAMVNEKCLGHKSQRYYRQLFGKASLRYQLREFLLPYVRRESLYLHKIQTHTRRSWLDNYFSYSATLGTHVFFMLALPIFFWSGCINFTLDITQLFAAGVYVSGIVKDFLCLPRPLSPPLIRLTLSSDAECEYGFPSTHTTNAVSTGCYSIFFLISVKDSISPLKFSSLLLLSLVYIFSISLGRIYCGMHGFMDVSVGSLMGLFLACIQWKYGDLFHSICTSASFHVPIGVAALSLYLIWLHPLPAEQCICIDDSISFVSVIMGIDMGTWLSSPESINYLISDINAFFLIRFMLRVIFGVTMILFWKSFAKQVLLSVLPQIYKTLRIGHWQSSSGSKGIHAASGSSHVLGTTKTPLGNVSAHECYENPSCFDSETMARIIIYAGIGFLSTYFAPIVFRCWRI
ncbi:sphingosine-1-phosphate phosphatase [Schizosaccharomyces cryophilus OY26]|uniref:Sphingosine-1-phosphate phosphatase n=1 Tax=Schizosaccharomyces cryophilus (strain OY26 / ATCC MYA-4695 / CBS 11777 / NBRC 106824 / NRRL Y48691) TaxID=653667 RepID=S9VXV3_SCHCR|nr:sphingosine-1-phosphate phosphatase [Schizosaccharomyces cryophilus OY26]EPY52418.1 sphingosine-1-phosphate phosphatase [Schizosaccharomyces cryophilus OY26]